MTWNFAHFILILIAQYWPIFSFGIYHLPWFLAVWKSRYFSKICFLIVFAFLTSFCNSKSREDKIDCCNNLGSYVLVKVGFKWMRQTLVDLRVLKVGPRPQNTIFLISFVSHTGSVKKTWNLANCILFIVALDWSMYWLFHWYKNKQKLGRDGTRKTELWKKCFFCILIREQ